MLDTLLVSAVSVYHCRLHLNKKLELSECGDVCVSLYGRGRNGS